MRATVNRKRQLVLTIETEEEAALVCYWLGVDPRRDNRRPTLNVDCCEFHGNNEYPERILIGARPLDAPEVARAPEALAAKVRLLTEERGTAEDPEAAEEDTGEQALKVPCPACGGRAIQSRKDGSIVCTEVRCERRDPPADPPPPSDANNPIVALMREHPEVRWTVEEFQKRLLPPSTIGAVRQRLAKSLKKGSIVRAPHVKGEAFAVYQLPAAAAAPAPAKPDAPPATGPTCPICGVPCIRVRKTGKLICINEECAAHEPLPAPPSPPPPEPPPSTDQRAVDIGNGRQEIVGGSNLALCVDAIRRRAPHWVTGSGILEVIRQHFRKDLPQTMEQIIAKELGRQRKLRTYQVPGLEARQVGGRWEYRMAGVADPDEDAD